jgi:propionyl-CoA carboxylase alpha chain
MFRKILIANRGEIACRIIKTCRKLEIATVAVYSEPDARSLHVDLADQKVCIGPAAASQSYLNAEKIVDVCRRTGADAVHPGYGFLSERADFARLLAAENIIFIGPNASAIDAMGDKIESKKAAARAGVSTVPGFLGEILSTDQARKIAGEIGYPVMLKASAGGGGKGMRIAYQESEIEEGFAMARAEAKSSFGDDRLFIEKFIVNPRHIEIQVLGDKHGNVIHLGERECSIQRRNQKIIEEAPSPLLSSATRKAMGEQAVALAKAVGYDSAGTVEFVAGQDQSFYFLEMNTRLQVEHPVTELVTGIDLVEQMIRVAAGERLSIKQEGVKLNGSAIECRVYAEDPRRNFMPSIGRLTSYHPPNERTSADNTVRIDAGVTEGSEISIWYDPMIAKLCTHARTRAEAIAAMSKALDEYVIEGISHNIPFLSSVMENQRWMSGTLSTGFIAEEYPSGFEATLVAESRIATLAQVAVLLDYLDNRQRRQIGSQMNGRPVHFSTNRVVQVDGQWRSVALTPQLEEIARQGTWSPLNGRATFDLADGNAVLKVKRITNGYRLEYRGAVRDVRVYSDKEAVFAQLMPLKKSAGVSNKLRCPMPGLVVSILVHEGQSVKAGESLAIVEAMKMQNVLRADRDVSVRSVHTKPGETLAVDAVIMEFA